MGNGDGAIFGQQQLRHGLADDVGAADDHGLEAIEFAQRILGQHDGAHRRAGDQRLLTGRQLADVHDMEAIDVLGGIDGGQHLHRVDMLRKRQLHENAVAGGVAVELLDQRQHIGLGRFGGKPVLPRVHADFDGLLRLVGDIDSGGRILAHQHHREAGGEAVLCLEFGHGLCNAAAQGFGIGLAVDEFRHGQSIQMRLR